MKQSKALTLLLLQALLLFSGSVAYRSQTKVEIAKDRPSDVRRSVNLLAAQGGSAISLISHTTSSSSSDLDEEDELDIEKA